MAAVALTLAVATAAGACGGSATTVSVVAPPPTVDIGAGLTGPSGLTAEVLARGLTDVSAFAIDDQGRLWAATAAFEDAGTDAIHLVDPASGSTTEVVTEVHTPMGLAWLDGWLYLASTSRVDAFAAYDPATGAFAQQRTVLELPDGIGPSNGLVAGPDGRLHLGISAPCDSCEPGSDLSGSVISFLPDGSDRRVDVHDVRAAVGLAYLPGTDDLFATLNQRDDLGDATPGDLLAVLGAGQDWGFPSCTGLGPVAGVDASVCAGVPEPVAVLDQHAAVSGLAFISGALGAGTGTSAVVAEWATGKVKRVAIAGGDGEYRGTASDFIGGIEHPVPVLTTDDGALLVGDWATGTVYRIRATAG